MSGHGVGESGADRSREATDVGRGETEPGDPVGDGLAETAGGRGDQRGAGGRRLQGDDPERFVSAGKHHHVAVLHQFGQSRLVDGTDETDRPRHLVVAGDLPQPRQLRAVTGDRQHRSPVGAPNACKGRDGVLDTLLVFQAPREQQARGAVVRDAAREWPRIDVDAVVDGVDLGQFGAEQPIHLVPHRRRTGDHGVGLGCQPPLHRMDLLVHPSADPSAVPARLGGVEGTHQRHVEVFGQSYRRMSDEPVVGVYDVGLPRALAVNVFRIPEPETGADERVAESQDPRHHVLTEHKMRGIFGRGDHANPVAHRVGTRMCESVAARGLSRQHHHVVPRSDELGCQVVDVPSEAADHHRGILPGDDQDPHVIASAGKRRASSPGKTLSARFQRADRVSAHCLRPRSAASQISLAACAWVYRRRRA